jgi:fucose permease
VAASLSGMFTPLVIGGLIRVGVDWRAISVLTVLLLALLATSFRHETIPDGVQAPSENSKKISSLPFSFWLYWIVLFFLVAVEMTLAVWATDFFVNVVGLSRTNAVLAFGVFPAAMLIGRLAGSRLTRFRPGLTLLYVALGVSLIGFPIFWLARIPVLNIIGLFITGLGIANQYPLTLSIAVGYAKEKTNQASARITLGVGLALLISPLVLGWLADRLGLQIAFGMVIVLMVTAIAVIMLNNRFLLNNTLPLS